MTKSSYLKYVEQATFQPFSLSLSLSLSLSPTHTLSVNIYRCVYLCLYI